MRYQHTRIKTRIKKVAVRVLFRHFGTLNGGYRTVTLTKKCYWTVGHGLAYNLVTFFCECKQRISLSWRGVHLLSEAEARPRSRYTGMPQAT